MSQQSKDWTWEDPGRIFLTVSRLGNHSQGDTIAVGHQRRRGRRSMRSYALKAWDRELKELTSCQHPPFTRLIKSLGHIWDSIWPFHLVTFILIYLSKALSNQPDTPDIYLYVHHLSPSARMQTTQEQENRIASLTLTEILPFPSQLSQSGKGKCGQKKPTNGVSFFLVRCLETMSSGHTRRTWLLSYSWCLKSAHLLTTGRKV